MKILRLLPFLLLFLTSGIHAQKNTPQDLSSVTDTSVYRDIIYSTEDKLLLDKQLNDINAELEKTKIRLKYLKIHINDLKNYQVNTSQIDDRGIFDQPYSSSVSSTKLYEAENDLLDNYFNLGYKENQDATGGVVDETYDDIVASGDLEKMIAQKINSITMTPDFRAFDEFHNFKYLRPYYSYYDNASGTTTDAAYSSNDPKKYLFVKSLHDSLSSLQKSITAITGREVSRIQSEITLQQYLVKRYKDERSFIYGKFEEKTTDLSHLAISWGIPWFSCTIAGLFLFPLLIKLWGRWKGIEFTNDSSYRVMLAIGTVFLLTTSIMILGLAGQLSKEVLGTLIGGISAYVLNNVSRERKSAPVTTATIPLPVTPPVPPSTKDQAEPDKET